MVDVPAWSFFDYAYVEFTLLVVDAQRLTALLREIADARRETTFRIGGAAVRIAFGSDVGRAHFGADEGLVFQTNSVDLCGLADHIDAAARAVRDDLPFLDHVHLEPTFLYGTDEIRDIVFQVMVDRSPVRGVVRRRQRTAIPGVEAAIRANDDGSGAFDDSETLPRKPSEPTV